VKIASTRVSALDLDAVRFIVWRRKPWVLSACAIIGVAMVAGIFLASRPAIPLRPDGVLPTIEEVEREEEIWSRQPTGDVLRGRPLTKHRMACDASGEFDDFELWRDGEGRVVAFSTCFAYPTPVDRWYDELDKSAKGEPNSFEAMHRPTPSEMDDHRRAMHARHFYRKYIKGPDWRTAVYYVAERNEWMVEEACFDKAHGFAIELRRTTYTRDPNNDTQPHLFLIIAKSKDW